MGFDSAMARWARFRGLWVVLLLCPCGGFAAPDFWPQFRGPRGDGSTTSTNLPLRWSDEENIQWQTPIHGRGWSSPVIQDGQVWLTTATQDGKELFVVCVDADSGAVFRDFRIFEVAQPQYCHPYNTYASPTPVIEQDRVYITFGAPGTACLDTTTGEVLWTRRDIECNHFRGAGSSPILYCDLLILNFDGSDHQYVVALDKRTGRTVWRTQRSVDFRDLDPAGKPQMEGDYRKAFATCHVGLIEGMAVLLSQGSKAFYAYDLATGEEVWRVEDRSCYSGSTRPVVGKGMIFVPSGFPSGQLLAIRPGRKGEVLDVKAGTSPASGLSLAWQVRQHVPKKPSLTLVGDLLFGIEDNGTATCWSATDGQVRWCEKLGGHFSASPLTDGNRLYLFSEEGRCFVLSATPSFRKLSENVLGDGFMASPAESGGALFLRSRTRLYKVAG